MKRLETQRLVLRAWKKDDVDDLYNYAKNPNVGPNAGWEPHTDKAISSKIINLFIRQNDIWAITLKENKKVIGSVGLHKDEKRQTVKTRQIGYVLSEEYWHKGLATEAVLKVIDYAFTEMGLDLLSAYHYPYNKRSRNVIEKCGFKYEGTLRQSTINCDGDTLDTVCYSLLRAEYEELCKNTIPPFNHLM